MQTKQRSKNRSILIPVVLGLLTGGLSLPLFTQAGGRLEAKRERLARKISPVLLEQIKAQSSQDGAPIPVIVQVKPDFFRSNQELRRRRGETRHNALPLINGYTARLTADQVGMLLDSEMVEYVTRDAVIRPSGSISEDDDAMATVGVNYIRSAGNEGQGTVIAVFDSGMGKHPGFAGPRRAGWVDFTSGFPVIIDKPEKQDKYGHGTAVAGIIGGKDVAPSYDGVAPEAQFLDVKVVGDDGTGLTSNLIAAIDWVIVHKDEYNVRVANLSLGHPPLESHAQDPLCQAVERMVEAGIVTVVSAGNLGKTEDSPEIWGGISSPGIDPAVITVSAVNTRGTVTQSDIIPTTYSSRGPTYPDNFFKPDLVASGNRVLSMSFKGSYIATNHPELKINEKYIYLSGSSMATAYVSGTAALMLTANPELTPRMVKAILLLTSTKLPGLHMLEQGNGMLNAYTAVRLAEALDVPNRTVTANVAPYWDLQNERIWSGGALATGDQIVYSELVDGSSQGQLWGDGVLWSDGLFWTDGIFWVDSIFWTDSLIWNDGSLQSDAIFWTDSQIWPDGVFWSDAIFWVDSIVWSENSLYADGIFWADQSGATHTVFEPDP